MLRIQNRLKLIASYCQGLTKIEPLYFTGKVKRYRRPKTSIIIKNPSNSKGPLKFHK